MKKKLVYVSPDNFFDVDFPVLKRLSSKFYISWFAVFNKNPRYTKEEIFSFANDHNIKLIVYERDCRKRSLKSFFLMKRLVFDIKNSKADIIYIEYLRDIFFVLVSIMFLNTNRVVQAIHDVIPHKKISNYFIMVFLDKLVFNKYKYFHIFSDTQAKIFESKYPNKEYFVAPLMLKNFGSRLDVNLSKEPVEFLFFGVISYYKGLDSLIIAIEKLINFGYDNIKLTIAGKGDFWDTCKDFISNKNLPFYNLKIEFVQNSEIPLIFAKAHYLVLPYRDVTQSGVLFTSYYYNVPIIAPKLKEFETYIDDKINGFLYDNSNNDGLFNTLKFTIENHDKYDFLKSNLKTFVNTELSDHVTVNKYDIFFKTIHNEN